MASSVIEQQCVGLNEAFGCRSNQTELPEFVRTLDIDTQGGFFAVLAQIEEVLGRVELHASLDRPTKYALMASLAKVWWPEMSDPPLELREVPDSIILGDTEKDWCELRDTWRSVPLPRLVQTVSHTITLIIHAKNKRLGEEAAEVAPNFVDRQWDNFEGGVFQGAGAVEAVLSAGIYPENSAQDDEALMKQFEDRVPLGASALKSMMMGLNILPQTCLDALIHAGFGPFIYHASTARRPEDITEQLIVQPPVFQAIRELGAYFQNLQGEEADLPDWEMLFANIASILSKHIEPFSEEGMPQALAGYYAQFLADLDGPTAMSDLQIVKGVRALMMGDVLQENASEAMKQSFAVLVLSETFLRCRNNEEVLKTYGCPAALSGIFTKWYQYYVDLCLQMGEMKINPPETDKPEAGRFNWQNGFGLKSLGEWLKSRGLGFIKD